MRLRVTLHVGHDDEPGLEAWAPELPGFATWAPTEPELDARLPVKLEEHCDWLRRHGHVAPSRLEYVVAERIDGGEVLFDGDTVPASPQEIDEALRLLAASRADVLADLDGASDALLDWDPPYERFATWADWRTIRANLVHVANAETHYYLRSIGHRSRSQPATPDEDWRALLRRTREEAVEFLRALRTASDRARVSRVDHGFGVEDWSVRKALRRMIRHERMHRKSIQRIRGEFERRTGARP